MNISLNEQYHQIKQRLEKHQKEYKENPSPELEELIIETKKSLERVTHEIKSEYNF